MVVLDKEMVEDRAEVDEGRIRRREGEGGGCLRNGGRPEDRVKKATAKEAPMRCALPTLALYAELTRTSQIEGYFTGKRSEK